MVVRSGEVHIDRQYTYRAELGCNSVHVDPLVATMKATTGMAEIDESDTNDPHSYGDRPRSFRNRIVSRNNELERCEALRRAPLWRTKTREVV